MKQSKTIIGAVALGAMLTAGGALAGEKSTVIFVGADGKDNSNSLYIGGVTALNGNLGENGLLLRGVALGGEYDYDTTAVAGGDVDADMVRAELSLGYQWFLSAVRLSLYVGIDHQDHDLSPDDPMNSVEGSETGVIGQAELETLGKGWYLSLMGNSSSANDSYWARGRIGYAFDQVNIGPEIGAAGNDEYEEDRYGVYVTFNATDSVKISLSGGHSDTDGDDNVKDDDGGYLTGSVSVTF